MALAVLLFCLTTAVLVQYGARAEEGEFYIGAVVEYEPLEWDGYQPAQHVLMYNANRYVKIIQEAKKENADIIVFPESGLTSLNMPTTREKMEPFLTFIPEPEHGVIPCDDTEQVHIAEHLRLLSCAAKSAEMYIVVNMDEKKRCTSAIAGCPKDHLLYYNTNVVFDRAGLVIAKYRKYNLFNEPEINKTALPQYSTFKTDFGATFGMFVCFDILFPEPAETLVSKYGVTDVVYSTAWFSELPMLTAAQTQAGYSYTMNVNLLAAGYNRPEFYNAGSGIYAGDHGPIVMIMPEEHTTKLLVGRVPKGPKGPLKSPEDCEEDELDSCPKPNGKVIDIVFDTPLQSLTTTSPLTGLSFFKEDMSKFSFKPLQNADSYEGTMYLPVGDEKVTTYVYVNGGYNCSIKVKWIPPSESNSEGPTYMLVGYAGQRTYASKIETYIEVCAVVACPDDKTSSCGLRPSFKNPATRTNILSIDIETQSSTKITTPFVMTLDENILPLMGNEVNFIESIDKYRGNLQKAFMFLEKPRSNLISFGVYKQ